MKKHQMKANLIFWLFLFFTGLSCNSLFAKNEMITDTIQTVLDKYIPSHYDINQMAEGNLNNDTLTDYALIIRHSEIQDSVFLIILFQKSPEIFQLSLKSKSLVSENNNELWITDDNVLHIKTSIPWNGENTNTDEIKFINNHWLYVGHSSSAFEPADSGSGSWSNSVNFITGEFKIQQDVTDKENKLHTRKISGFIDKKGPISIKEDCTKYMVTKYKGKDIYIFGRANLWRYDEIKKLNK